MPILCPHKRTHFFFFKKKKSRKETGIIFSFLLADLEIKIHREEVNSVVSEASMEHLFRNKTCLQLHVEASRTQMLQC